MNDDITGFLYLSDLFGSVVFSISGALAACERRMDVFGMAALAIVTAIGGGTLRDMMLGLPAFWLSDTTSIWLALGSTALCFAFSKRLTESSTATWLLVFDAFGLAVFAVEGAAKAFAVTDSFTVAIMMGMLTGAGGGIIRDVLSAQMPLIFRKEIYATAALLGAGMYVVLARCGLSLWLCVMPAILATLVLRLLAISYNLTLPRVYFPRQP